MTKETGTVRPVFRESAVRNYTVSKEKDVLPRFLKRPLFGFLWVIFGLFIIGLGLLWQMPIPGYFSGIGTVVKDEDTLSPPTLLLLLPKQSSIRAQVGKTIRLKIEGNSSTSGSIVALETNPDKVQARYKQAKLTTDTTTAVLMEIKLDPYGTGILPEKGQPVAVQAQADSYKVVTFLPFLDWLK